MHLRNIHLPPYLIFGRFLIMSIPSGARIVGVLAAVARGTLPLIFFLLISIFFSQAAKADSRLEAGIADAAALAGRAAGSAAVQGDMPASLFARLAGMNACGSYDAAIAGTSRRLADAGLAIPSSGKIILVNVAGQRLYAYEDGRLVLESRVVVGAPAWATPMMDTRISYIRCNPTWSDPQSIISYQGWRERVRMDPDHFARQDFLLVGESGETLTPHEAAASGSAIRTFVQQPGPQN